MSRASREANITDEQKKKNILDTYKYLKKEYQIKTDQVMADVLSIPYATLRSFLQNPLSASTAKISICSYFDLSPRDLDEGRLLNRSTEEIVKNNYSVHAGGDDIPLVQCDPYEIFKHALENGAYEADDELSELDRNVNGLLNFKLTLQHARNCFLNKDYQSAYIAYNSVILELAQNNIQALLKSDIENIYYLSGLLDNTSGLNTFVDKIVSDELYHFNIVFSAKELVKHKYPDMAVKCLESIRQHEAIV